MVDSFDNPTTGTFASQIIFYGTQTSTTTLQTIKGTMSVVAGVFAQSISPAEAVISLSEVWYTLAIDIDMDGIDASDLFGDRFQVTSVPFALSSQASTYFNTWWGTNFGQSEYR